MVYGHFENEEPDEPVFCSSAKKWGAKFLSFSWSKHLQQTPTSHLLRTRWEPGKSCRVWKSRRLSGNRLRWCCGVSGSTTKAHWEASAASAGKETGARRDTLWLATGSSPSGWDVMVLFPAACFPLGVAHICPSQSIILTGKHEQFRGFCSPLNQGPTNCSCWVGEPWTFVRFDVIAKMTFS